MTRRSQLSVSEPVIGKIDAAAVWIGGISAGPRTTANAFAWIFPWLGLGDQF